MGKDPQRVERNPVERFPKAVARKFYKLMA